MRLRAALVVVLVGVLLALGAEAKPRKAGRRETAGAKREAAALVRQAEFQRKSGKAADAYRSYEALLSRFKKRLSKKQRRQAEQALVALRSWTAVLRFSQPPGPAATITLDGATVEAPSRPLRVDPGRHTVQATRAGADPFASVVQLAPGQDETVEIKLAAESRGGLIAVRERTGADVAVVIDGREVGPAPWEGELEPGRHVVEARGARHEAASASVDVQRRGRIEIELVAVQVREHVKLASATEGASMLLDGQPQALPFDGPLALGKHSLELSAPGHRKLARALDVAAGKPLDERLVLEREVAAAAAVAAVPVVTEPERRNRFGVLASGGFPRVLQAEASLRLKDVVAIGFEWSYLPELTLADIRFHMTSYQGTLRWSPWRGAFHVGVGGGVQSYASSSGSTVTRARIDVLQPIVSPHLGWHWVFKSGLTLGVDVGVQLVLASDPKATLHDASGRPLDEATLDDDARGIRTDAQDLASQIVTTPLPTLSLKLGWYL